MDRDVTKNILRTELVERGERIPCFRDDILKTEIVEPEVSGQSKLRIWYLDTGEDAEYENLVEDAKND